MQHETFGHVMLLSSSMAPLHLFIQDIQMRCDITSLDHVMPLMLVLVSHDADSGINSNISLLGKDDQNEMQCDFLGHVMPMASLMAPLHLFHHNNQNEVQHWHFCWHHMMSWYNKMVPLHSLGQDN